MPRRLVHLPLVLGLLLALAVMRVLSVTSAGLAASADLEGSELALNPSGSVYELNADAQGLLWISDNGAGEIWALDPDTDVYTIYSGLTTVSDARADADGNLWWVDQANDQIARLAPGAQEAALWTVPGASILYGTAVDGEGDLWVTDFFRPRVYHFDPISTAVCTYTIPGDGSSDYVLAHAGRIWLGDWIGDSIHSLDPDGNQFTSWGLPVDARPEGLTADQDGNLWWADPDRGHLARLEPALDRLTRYPLPVGGTPEMVASRWGLIWYTEDWEGTVGVLNPTVATGISTTLVSGTTPVTPACSTLGPGVTAIVTTTTGVASWISSTYTLTVDADGWKIYQLPQDAYPWGVAISSGRVWMADTGRQVLASLPGHPGDGEIIVEKQTTPAGAAQSFTFTTSYGASFVLTDGQTHSSGLLAPGTYSVTEDLLDGWDLTSAVCSDGSDPSAIALDPGEILTCVFENTQRGEIVVEKQTTPAGAAQSFTFTTSYGASFVLTDGQTNSSGFLAPGTYSVTEKLLDGWDLTSAVCSDGSDPSAIALDPGEILTCTFENTQRGEIIVEKQTTPAGAAQSFPFTTTYGASFILTDGQTYSSDFLAPGTYSVSEGITEGWELASATCDDGSDPAAIELDPGETVICTFVNSQGRRIYLPLVIR